MALVSGGMLIQDTGGALLGTAGISGDSPTTGDWESAPHTRRCPVISCKCPNQNVPIETPLSRHTYQLPCFKGDTSRVAISGRAL